VGEGTPKTVRLYGRQLTVSGSEKDDYYRQLADGGDLTDPVLVAARAHLSDDATCLDVGANIGLYSLALSAVAPEGRIYAFEPSPSAFSHLQENVRANGIGQVETTQVAVSDRVGSVTFHDFSFFSAGSFSSDEGSLLSTDSYGSSAFQAATTTLDTFVAERGIGRVDVIKIDVEGAELGVLEGAAEVLAKHQPVVLLEFNSFGFTIHQSVLPQVALARLKEIFPFVFVMDRVDGSLSRLETPHEDYEFLYDNGIHGPADNLICTFTDLDVTRRYSHVWTLQRGAGSDVGLETPGPIPLTEAEAMRRTVSWRLTAPLRTLRVRLKGVPVIDKVSGRLRKIL
jgi:FkbM family methyltransferase